MAKGREFESDGESARGLAQSGTLARGKGRWAFRQVLECGGPLPL